MRPLPQPLLVVVTIAGAAAGAALFRAADAPLAYILGALVGSALVTNVFGPMRGGSYIRRAGQLLVGASVGGVLTGDVLAELARLFPLMLAVAVAANAAGVLLAYPIARLAGVTPLTGLLSCLPAGMAEMASLAREMGAHEQTVTVVHTLRVVLILTMIPLWLGTSGFQAGAPPATSLAEATEILGIVAVGGLLAAAASRFGVLNPWVIAPMLLCLALVAAGFPVPQVPTPLLLAAQIAIGAALGLRFRLEEFGRLPRAVLAGLASGLVLIAVAGVLFAGIAQLFGGLSFETATLAVMPGGLGEMIASAAALGLAPATVAGFQITRSILTNMVAPPLIRLAVAPRGGPST